MYRCSLRCSPWHSTMNDADLPRLIGASLESIATEGVRYKLERALGEGAHSVVFEAERSGSDGSRTVVVKVLRPRAVRELGALAAPSVAKEVAALKMLSNRIPATPYVVAFLDSGTISTGERSLALPWIAVEFVSGGLEGVTLRERVANSIRLSGRAFDRARAGNVVHCLTVGMSAIHEAGVIHRDLTPNNVLATGPLGEELYKIADFGLARVASATTFGDVLLGTPGYCAPEQSFPEDIGVGPYTDVFGLACTIYFSLTGEKYFEARSIPEMLLRVHQSERRSILGAPRLSEALRSQVETCHEVDAILAHATRRRPHERFQSASELGAALLAVLCR